ncbi:hypothetical protein [Sulfobacillus thermosulfidooxidans]|uniref:hypothetical protein n=1 Tax=Sulfobacillus thermosulfidooxidans TaxID=28034 RepID=UPI0006B5E0AB|nr:hypothetical protein [Sulfobacillus thermosulfidooxidans]
MSFPLLIGCVDNHPTRQILHPVFLVWPEGVYIDAGNDGIAPPTDPESVQQTSGYGGHVVIGYRHHNTTILPPVGMVYPDILTDTTTSLPGTASGHQAVSQPQRMITNVWAAMTVMIALNTVLAEQHILWDISNFNAYYSTHHTQALTPSYWHSLHPLTSP